MTQSHSTSTALAPASVGRPSTLTVMALRAAEQHVLVVVGEADLHTAGQLRTQIIDALWAEPPSLLVELGALEFCDLAGLDALHDGVRAAHDAGIALTFRGMSAQLAWLHATFPPRSPVPLSSQPGLAQSAADTDQPLAGRSPTPGEACDDVASRQGGVGPGGGAS